MPRVQRFYQVTVSTDIYQVVPYNKQRVGILIKNNAGATVYVSNDQTDPVSFGFPLAVGDYLAFITTQGDIPELQLYAITEALTADLRIVETFGEIPELA